MLTILALTTAQLRMYFRDRQSVFLSFFFPIMLMTAFGFIINTDYSATDIALVGDKSANPELVQLIENNDLFAVQTMDEPDAREALGQSDITLAIILPDAPLALTGATNNLNVLMNAADPQGSQQALAILNASLTRIEHDIRNTKPLFALNVEDIQSRSFRYIEFLIPGLLAFMTMQLAISGSGFNIVEYKRKGILKRMFVTPLAPSKFIISLIIARLITILVQLALILGFGMLVFHAQVQGNLALMILFAIFGGILFLSLGFALGGIANTQNAIIMLGNLFIFPQVFLASVFFPLDTLPEWLRLFASLLPLTFLSHALRQIANEGAGIMDLGFDLSGLAAWTAIGLFLAIRFFRWGEGAKG